MADKQEPKLEVKYRDYVIYVQTPAYTGSDYIGLIAPHGSLRHSISIPAAYDTLEELTAAAIAQIEASERTEHLERIAKSLERIADALDGGLVRLAKEETRTSE